MGTKRKRRAFGTVGDGLSDERAFKAGKPDDVTGVRLGNFDALHALEMINGCDLADFLVAIAVDASAGIADLDLAANDFAQRYATDVFGVIQVRDEHLETFAGMRAGRGNVFNDRIEKRLHGSAGVGPALDLGESLPSRWHK